jgi:uncharacterized protein YcfJ
MNRSMIVGIVLGVGVATAGGAIAGYKIFKEPDGAEVLNTQAITKQVKVPHKECEDKTVVHQREVKDDNRVAGKAIGAVLGGVLGHQVGGGNGKKVATVAGAVAGGYAGDRVQDNMQKKDTYTTVENVCSTTYTTREDITGYDVTYRLKGKESVVRMSYDPGSKIPLQNGQLVLTPPADK